MVVMWLSIAIVYGWFADTFVGLEREEDYSILVGYQKRRSMPLPGLAFRLEFIDQDSAGKCTLTTLQCNINQDQLFAERNDFTFDFRDVTQIGFIPVPAPRIRFGFPTDGIVEDDESFAMQLVDISQDPLIGRGVFFREVLELTIVDTDGEGKSILNLH